MADKRSGETGFIQINGDPGQPAVVLSGNWTVSNAAVIEQEIDTISHGKTHPGRIDASGVTRMDTAGAWIVKKYLLQGGVEADFGERQKALLDFIHKDEETAEPGPAAHGLESVFVALGRKATGTVDFTYGLMSFIGEVFICLFRNLLRPRHLRFPSIVRHVNEAGIQALPIIGLLGFLMSMVVAYQAAMQLQKFGADLFVVDLTVISMLREMGVLVTAIMVAGRSGSAFAAEIGVMKLREEVDALRTMSMDPIEVLVVPRVIALVIVLPLLAFLAALIGLAGGAVTALLLLDIPLYQYIDRAGGVANPTMFFVGMIKAPVFAFLIAIIGTYQGMNVTGSAESVGKLTTVAVVQSIFLVILADAFFSIIFANVGI